MPDQKQGPFTTPGCEGKRSLCMCVSLSLWVSLPLCLYPFPSLSECRRGQHTMGTQESLSSASPARAGRGKDGSLREAMVLKGKGRMETERDRKHPPHTEEVSPHLLPLRLHLLASLMTQRLRCVYRSEGPHPLTWGWNVVARG